MQSCCSTSTTVIGVGAGESAVPPDRLLIQDEMPAAVLLPARLIRFVAERLLLAEGDRAQIVRIHALLHEHVLHRFGTVGAEREVVLDRAALVSMALDGDVPVRILLQESRRGLQ